MIDAIQEPNVYLQDFQGIVEGSSPALRRTRLAAMERFEALGFPGTRDEDWRFTNIAPLAATAFRLGTPDGAAIGEAQLHRTVILDPTWPRLVFVNGHFAPHLSGGGGVPDIVTARSLAQQLADDPQSIEAELARHASFEDRPFVALNTAFLADGAHVVVPAGMTLDQPIHVLFISAGGDGPMVTHPRNLIIAEAGSSLTLVESYLGLGGGTCFTNGVTEIVARENANVDHYKLGFEGADAYHIGATQIHQARDSTVSSFTLTAGGALVRNDITTVLDGAGGHCTLNGLYLASGRQHVDNHLRVEHAAPHCDSREFFKGILDDRARAVFTGRIVVHKDAQKTDAKQTNMNLLLSGAAQVDTKPQLEIFADDVKCTHGATIGQIDEDAIFYLRARGIKAEAARGLLVHAFADECVQRVRPRALRDRLGDLLLERLPYGETVRGTL